jgi:Zn finger protein HypA/HybF involved in hydrogenase expression
MGSIDCPECGTEMELKDIDFYCCPHCGKEVDMIEDEDGY